MYSGAFSQFIAEVFKVNSLSKTKYSYGNGRGGSWAAAVTGCPTKRETVPSPEEQTKNKKQNWDFVRQMQLVMRYIDENMVKAFLRGDTKDPHKQKFLEAIRNRVASHSMRIIKTSSGIVHLVTKMYRDLTYMKTVEVPGEYFNKAIIRHLILGTRQT